MATDLTLRLTDQPGALAAVGQALGTASVNIEGGCGVTSQGEGVVHLLVEDADAATQALADAGFSVEGREEVLVLDADDRPGALGEITASLADAGVNLTLFYLATATRVVLGVDDLERARTVIT